MITVLTIVLSCLAFANLLVCDAVSNTEVITDDTGRVRGFTHTNGTDIAIGAFFAVHDSSPNGDCSSDIISRALERIEAFLYSIDQINNDPLLLPNITLGYSIRDTCTLENIALDETISLLFGDNGVDKQCDSSYAPARESVQELPIRAIIGPTSSHVAIPVAGLLRLFNVPQVSYAASSPALSNRNRYGYFYRTIPPDDLQAQAMIDLLLKLDWTLVNIIHSNDEYGETGSERFRQLATDVGICIDIDAGIDEGLADYQIADLATRIYDDLDTNVVVLFASYSFIDPFIRQIDYLMNNSSKKRELWWIASESWAQSNDIVHQYHNVVANRLLGLAPLSTSEEDLSNFTTYLANLTTSSNTRNPWFSQFIAHHHDCTAGRDCLNDSNIFDNTTYSVTPFVVELVVESVYSIAHALHDYFSDNCGGPWDVELCGIEELNGSTLVRYLQNVSFTSPFGKHVYFDHHGNPGGSYEITNYLSNLDNDFSFTRIGIWEEVPLPTDQRLQLSLNNLTDYYQLNSSRCPICPDGSIKVIAPTSCCGVCHSCLGQSYSNTTITTNECDMCSNGSWGNDPLMGSNSCVTIQQRFLGVHDEFGIVLLVLACLGTLFVVTIATLMAVLWNTSVIKSSGREQMILLLFSVLMCFLQTIFFLIKPSIAVCFFQRSGTWFCFSIILSALLIKLVRIIRIFLGAKNTSKPPRFIQPGYQIVFSLILVTIQMLLVAISMIVVNPNTSQTLILDESNTNDHPSLLLQCSAPHTVMFTILILYYSLLLIVSNALAVLTLKFPDNFNESKYVAFTTFSVGLIWVAFCASYFATKPQYHTALFSFAIQFSAVAVLVCFFLPRIINATITKYFTKTDLYTTSSSTTGNDKRLSLMIERQNLPHRIAGELAEDDLSTQTFK